MQEFECEFDNGMWIYAGTVEDNQADAQRDAYENNPIVKTLRHVLQEQREYTTTATNFKAEMLKLYGEEAEDVKADKRIFDKLQSDLYLNDGISYEYKLSGGAWHIFRQNQRPETLSLQTYFD